MSKTTVLFVFGTLILAFAHQASAQPSKVYHVGVLSVGSPTSPTLKGLRDGFQEGGYIEGKNLLLDIPLNKTYDELRPIVKAYKDKKMHAVVAIGGTATGIAKKATLDLPIVFLSVIDPVGLGFVKSLARPQTNMTGLTSFPDSQIQGKRLEIFKEVVPSLTRVVVLYNARVDAPHHTVSFDLVRKVAPSLGLKLEAKPIKLAGEVEQALSSVSKETADGIFIICSGLFRASYVKIATIARNKRLPLMGCFIPAVAERGGLLDYDSDIYAQGHRGAWYVDRILKGIKPQDLPVETPTKFELVINLKTAKQIGLTIPPNVLVRADKVIK